MSEAARKRIFPFELQKSGLKTALVVGGAGFLGSFISEQLISQGIKVICIDNLTSGAKENIKDLINNEGFSFLKANVNSPDFSIPAEVKIDIVIHAAGIEEFSVDKELSLETLLVNSLGTRILLELAKAKKAKFILVSSADLQSGVFSSTSLRYYFGKEAANESTFTHNEAKRFAEALVFEYFKNYNLNAVVVRVKDVFGPRMSLNAEGDINKVIAGAISGKKATIIGDGLKILNPTFVTDVSNGIVKAATVGVKGEIYNLVSPDKINLEKVVQTTKQVVGNVEIAYKSSSDDLELPYHQLDVSTSYKKLNWRPTVNLGDGISQTVTYFRQKSNEINDKPPGPLFVDSQNKNNKKFINISIPHLAHVRLVIFLSALALVIITVFYPGLALLVNTYQADSNFKAGIKSLNTDQVKQAILDSERAEDAYKKAATNLQNLNWLLQIFVGRERLTALDDFYFVGEKFSTATYQTAQALDILITQSSIETRLGKEDLAVYLQSIITKADDAKIDYELGAANLENLQSGDLPKALRDDLVLFQEADIILEDILEELLVSTDT